MQRKYSYLLFELLVAFSIVCMCMPLLLRSSFKTGKEELAALETLELQKKADLRFADIKADFYAEKMKWEELLKETNEKYLYHKSPEVKLDGISKRTFEETCFITIKGQKEGATKKEKYFLLLVTIDYSSPDIKKTFPYYLSLKKSNET